MLLERPHKTTPFKKWSKEALARLITECRKDHLSVIQIYVPTDRFIDLAIREIEGIKIMPGSGLRDNEITLMF